MEVGRSEGTRKVRRSLRLKLNCGEGLLANGSADMVEPVPKHERQDYQVWLHRSIFCLSLIFNDKNTV